jgi:hypothetical protein
LATIIEAPVTSGQKTSRESSVKPIGVLRRWRSLATS